MQKTPLYQIQKDLGARFVDFAGWHLPVSFAAGLRAEHCCVRKHVGLFDVSHMGEIRLSGRQSAELLQHLTSNNVFRLKRANRAQYSLLLNSQGGIIDDVIVYCLKPGEDYLVCVNASNIEKDFLWIKEESRSFSVHIENESAVWGQLAVQGPAAMSLGESIWGTALTELKPFGFFQTNEMIVARTGYTGAGGFEVFVKSERITSLWQEILEKGKQHHIVPVGLGARDTLRIEMKYPLYGHDINEDTNPLEANLGWVVRWEPENAFIGKPALEKIKQSGPVRLWVGLEMKERGGVPRTGYVLEHDNEPIGHVTSGTVSPLTQRAIAIGYVKKDYAKVGTLLSIKIRNRALKMQVVETPFV